MELHNPFFISFITSFVFLFMLFKLVKRSSCNNSKTKLPPGPRTLPLIGNIHQIGGSVPHHIFRNLADKYGPLMHLKLGEVSNIVVTSAEMAKEIMKTHDLIFCDRPNLLCTTVLSYNATNIGFCPYGEYWRQLRKICTIELLSAKRVQSFGFIREEEVSQLVKTIQASEGSIVNLSEKIVSSTYGIIARAAFGKTNKYHKVIKSTIADALIVAGGFCVADLYPSIKVLKRMSRAKVKVEKLQRKIDSILQDIIDDHKSKKNSHSDEGEDLIDILLKFQLDKENPLTDDNIKAVIQDLFTGGGETTSATVVWGMAEMVKNPKIMEEAQAELRRVFDSKGYVDETELHQLIYLQCIIKETLRLHPSTPLLIPRESRERCQINGYEIPAKSRVIINAWAIGRDPKYWAEAESFKPERFLHTQIDFRGTDFEFIPFGAGRRICPGISFALTAIELSLAKLLYHFDWKLPNGMKNEELDMTESFGFTIRKANDLCLIPIPRRP